MLVDDAGKVTVDSRAICEEVLRGERAERLTPSPWQGPIWAYADWIDGPFEDVPFRIAAPGIGRRFERPADAALFVFIKERKFGRGCVDEWERNAGELIARVRGPCSRRRCQTLQPAAVHLRRSVRRSPTPRSTASVPCCAAPTRRCQRR